MADDLIPVDIHNMARVFELGLNYLTHRFGLASSAAADDASASNVAVDGDVEVRRPSFAMFDDSNSGPERLVAVASPVRDLVTGPHDFLDDAAQRLDEGTAAAARDGAAPTTGAPARTASTGGAAWAGGYAVRQPAAHLDTMGGTVDEHEGPGLGSRGPITSIDEIVWTERVPPSSESGLFMLSSCDEWHVAASDIGAALIQTGCAFQCPCACTPYETDAAEAPELDLHLAEADVYGDLSLL